MILRKIWREICRPFKRWHALTFVTQADLAQLRTSEQFNRQALHDIASTMLRGLETSDEGRRSAVGVVIATCDRPKNLRRALASVAAQSRRPDKLVVVNDGRTPINDIVEAFSSRLAISSLHTEHPYSGPSAARNLALDALDTPLVAFLDDDNLMWPTWIERASEYLEADSTIDIVYGAQLRDSEMSISDKFWFHETFDLERLKRRNFVDINQLVYRRNACRFDPGLRRFVDWDFLLRLVGDAPERIAGVPAIASLYFAAEENRITVIGWPPDSASAVLNEHVSRASVENGQKRCSCCGYSGTFIPGPNKRPNAGCPKCGSLERHRFLQLIGPSLKHHWIPETRRGRTMAIEIAPSGATAAFRDLFDRTPTIDADPDADGRVVDLVASLADLPVDDATADVMLVLHVLEHVPDDRQAMREIARALMPHGVAVLQVPLSGRPTTDEGEVGSVEERITRFGQADHVRFYGDDFFERLSEAGLETIAISPRQSMVAEVIEKYGLLPDQALVFSVRANSPRAVQKLKAFEKAIRKGASIMTR